MSVLVYTENWDGKFKKLSFELVSFAYAIAQQLGTDVVALSIGNVGDDELKKPGQYGAAKVLHVADASVNHMVSRVYNSIITQAAQKENAGVVILAHNNTGKALAPGLSVKLKAGLATAVTSLPLSTNPFIVTKKVFTGKAFTKMAIKSNIKILTLSQNSYQINDNPQNVVVENYHPVINKGLIKTELKDVQKQVGKVLLTDAEIVVSGGRGMKDPEFWKPIEELAELLCGAVACSRPVSDEGWRSHNEHVGQTGKIIAPNLYIACGISGAIQHLGGVSSSKFIVAINKDKDAPIFESADYGVVGDVHKVLPELIAAIRKAKE
jgi:electron transfer flavoprotein alpha subunit